MGNMPTIQVKKEDIALLLPGDHIFLDGEGCLVSSDFKICSFSTGQYITEVGILYDDFENHIVRMFGDILLKVRKRKGFI